MEHTGIRLEPLMFLLAVAGICVATLGILAIATANVDLQIARRYASFVKTRYALETEGQIFLCETAEAVLSENKPASLCDINMDTDGVVWKEIRREDCRLAVGIQIDEEGGLNVICWRIEKIWETETGMGDLWNGL